jgi:hypothetical protein
MVRPHKNGAAMPKMETAVTVFDFAQMAVIKFYPDLEQ